MKCARWVRIDTMKTSRRDGIATVKAACWDGITTEENSAGDPVNGLECDWAIVVGVRLVLLHDDLLFCLPHLDSRASLRLD